MAYEKVRGVLFFMSVGCDQQNTPSSVEELRMARRTWDGSVTIDGADGVAAVGKQDAGNISPNTTSIATDSDAPNPSQPDMRAEEAPDAADGAPSSADENIDWDGPLRADEGDFPTSVYDLFLDSGGVWFVMSRKVDDVDVISARRFDLSSKQWGNEVRLDEGVGNADRVHIDSNSNGDAIVVWEDWTTQDAIIIRAVNFSSESSSWSGVSDVATVQFEAHAGGLGIACSPDRGGLLMWSEYIHEDVPNSSEGGPVQVLHTNYLAKPFDGETWGQTRIAWKRTDQIPTDGIEFRPVKPVFADAKHVFGFFYWNGSFNSIAAKDGDWNDPVRLSANADQASAVALTDGSVQAAWLEGGSAFASRTRTSSVAWSSPTVIESISPFLQTLALTASPSQSPNMAATVWTAGDDVFATTLNADGTWNAVAHVNQEIADFRNNTTGLGLNVYVGTDASGRTVVLKGYEGFAIAHAPNAQDYTSLNTPSADGFWRNTQLKVLPNGTKLVAALLSDSDEGPEGGKDHVFLFVGN